MEKHNAITEQIIGAAIEVHRALGPGLLESAYEECLCHELALRELKLRRQVPLPIIYKSVYLDCGYRMDIVVENLVISVLKTWDKITIPAIPESGHREIRKPFLDPGAESDYLEFRDVSPWQLRDAFAGAIKKGIGKSVIALAYGSPIHRAFFDTVNLDGVGSMTYYPYRVAGYSTG